MPSPVTVLVVDDDHRARAALVRALDELPDLEAVGLDRDQAARLAARRSDIADAVVLDVPRADADALLLLSSLAARVPVLVTSLSGAARRPSRRAGASAFVEKDGDGDALVASISAHIRHAVAHNAPRPDNGEGQG